MERDQLLQEREKIHGDINNNARIFNDITRRLPDKLDGVHRFVIAMIIAKIARIHSGNAQERDHWDDIAGYAKLGSGACHPGDGKC